MSEQSPHVTKSIEKTIPRKTQLPRNKLPIMHISASTLKSTSQKKKPQEVRFLRPLWFRGVWGVYREYWEVHGSL